jgi:hypothetical protein
MSGEEIGIQTDRRVFYGPHLCQKCGRMIVRASFEDGGESFDQPDGPIYPNTVWVQHVCRYYELN